MAQATAIEQLMVKVPEILKGERQERISRAINTVAQRFSEASAAEYFALESTAPNELKAALLQQAGGSATVTRLDVSSLVLLIIALRVCQQMLVRTIQVPAACIDTLLISLASQPLQSMYCCDDCHYCQGFACCVADAA